MAAHAAELADRGFTRIDDFLPACGAQALEAELAGALPWHLSLIQGGRIWDATPEQQAALGEARLAAMAAQGADSAFRFLFDMVKVPDAGEDRAARGLLIDQLALAWSQPAALAIWRRLLGRDDISGLVMKATRYRPGHFLTIHDDGKFTHQIAAFILSLSHDWRPDWGGQLQVLNERREVETVLTPRFNALSLITVPRDHFVSMVAPFAPHPRLSITGWLCTGGD